VTKVGPKPVAEGKPAPISAAQAEIQTKANPEVAVKEKAKP
jgi:hypothetical protein